MCHYYYYKYALHPVIANCLQIFLMDPCQLPVWFAIGCIRTLEVTEWSLWKKTENRKMEKIEICTCSKTNLDWSFESTVFTKEIRLSSSYFSMPDRQHIKDLHIKHEIQAYSSCKLPKAKAYIQPAAHGLWSSAGSIAIYTVSQKWSPFLLLWLLGQMLPDFNNIW